MEGKTLLKLAIVVVVAIVIWKKGIPWWNAQHAGNASIGNTTPVNACVDAAAEADDTWGSGVGRFANPPYDLTAWDQFRSQVDSEAIHAQEKCLCADDACATAKQAMSDLRGLVQEMDQSLRGGLPPPDDLVQRQEVIDNAITNARSQAK